MTYKVAVTRRASRDAARLDAHLRARNPRAADKLSDQIAQAATSLEESPLRGRAVGATIREINIPFGRSAYIVRYRFKGRHVTITRIWHGLEQR
ncbi:type II toxin-antitoxin system RelE/ParE family toxin [Caulobacter zeae]|uniref:Type II toxin-antitoxin system RelE/ParE family toxin n=1 Tax=Caulobacter zeae TaxID=2055137 RepID=A0A2N5DFQ1_9CAUL|nr:type II toxin-antitoxin system RelE/ParE family toxin [Caulobacter zeae]PLR24881.1 type II toxin-antitoxin system RelE/ParE family toxin [Caulobacter zeae]